MKIKRYLILVLALSLLLTAVCMFTATAEGEVAEETTTPDMNLSIYAKNLSLENAIYISYAVPVAGTESADSVKLLIWMTPQDSYTYGTQTYELSPEGTTTIGSAQYYVFVFDKLAAKRMAVDIYAKVYATDGENEYYSALDKYSILQYAYNKLGKTSSSNPSSEMANLLNGMLDYGAYAQEYFGFNTDRLANDNYYQIKVNGATLSDGATHGLYLAGTQVTATAPEKNESGENFLYWQNSAGEKLSENLSYTITVGEQNEIYTAVYGSSYLIQVIGGTLPDGSTSGYYTSGTELTITAPETLTVTTDTEETVDFAFWKNEDGKIIGSKESVYTITVGTANESYTAVYDTPDSYFTFNLYGSSPYSYSIQTKNANNMPAEIVIPSTYNGKAVTKIVDFGFYCCNTVTNIIIPDSITIIGNSAFAECSNLTSVTLPANIETIGDYMFSRCSMLSTVSIPNSLLSISDHMFFNCTSLTNITIPNSVTSISNGAFSGCTGLTNITIPNSVTNIGNIAFATCSNLTNISIPSSVTTIGNSAFHGCTKLTSITIPNSVTSIGEDAFYYCNSLKSIYIDDLESWCKISFAEASSNPMFYGAKLYLNNELITKVDIPDNMSYIRNHVFYNCTQLTDITIPNSVTSIGNGAFAGCTGLTSVTIPNSVTNIGNGAFATCSNLTNIIVPNSVMNLGDSVFYNCTNLIGVSIPNSVTSIGNQMFYNCSRLVSITIPDSAITIGEKAFYNCSNLANVTIGNNVTNIGFEAFYGCTNLTNITIPDSVTNIGSSAFKNCTILTSITIPDSVTSIGSSAFYNCTSLKTVYYTGMAEQWAGISINSGNSYLTNATRYYYSETQPTTEGNYWYYVEGVPMVWEVLAYPHPTDDSYFTFTELSDGTYSVKAKDVNNMPSEVVIPETYNGKAVTSIDNYAFANCSGLTNITISDSVTNIGESAFYNCTSLTNITFPDSVTYIGTGVLSDCSVLENIRSNSAVYPVINNCLIKISSGTLIAGCKNSIIPADGSIKTIDSYAFSGCISLTSITIPNSVTDIGNYAFYNCTGLSSITIPNSVTGMGGFVFYRCTGLMSILSNSTAYPAVNNCLIDASTGTLIAGCRNSIIPTDGSVKCIGRSAFDSCIGFTSVTIPANVTSIKDWAFYNCTSLTNITISDSVTSIDAWAFYSCVNLKAVYYTGTVEQWAGISIGSGNTNLTNATRYYYSETQPTSSGNYWHYVDGVPTAW